MNLEKIDKIVSLCKRRGFIFPSAEIYGRLSSVYDFGPLGVELKNNIKKLWWQENVWKKEEIVGLDSSILTKKEILRASGHEKQFFDEFYECPKCQRRFRKEDLQVSSFKLQASSFKTCPVCKIELVGPKKMNLMFKTEDAYLRPETAQGIFANYLNILKTQRVNVPFGIAQIGKSFRNEVTPGNFIFKTLEFEQMEIEYFVPKEKADYFYKYWQEQRFNWYISLGIKKENLRIREHKKEELAHYALSCSDIEYRFPFGWKEIEGIANRGDYDLKCHEKYSQEKFPSPLPYIIEPSAGVERIFLALLCDSYEEIKSGRSCQSGIPEIVLHLHPKLSPIKIAVFPLVRNKPTLVDKARYVYDLVKTKFASQYDELGSIGRRYRRQDEIGTPFCLTIDFQTLKDETVTLRNRDTMKQERVKIEKIIQVLSKYI